MPQLADILDLARDGLLIMVELKMDAAGVPLVAAEVAKHPNVNPDRVMFSNGNGAVIAAVRRDLPGYRIYWIHGTHWGVPEHVVWPTTWELFQKLNACPEKPDGVFIAGQPIMDRGYWGEFKRAGYEVGIWTIDDPAEVKRYLDDGVDWVCTNYGSRCRDYILAERAKAAGAATPDAGQNQEGR
jgi:glycerophosphoryl diester phosphodiesterase